MAYTPQTWTDSPATTSPLTAARLNYMEAGIAAASGKTRAGVFPFEYPASTIAVAASAPYTVRQLFEIPLPVLRWRVVVGNYNAFADAFIASGGLTSVAIAVGTPVFGTDGVWTGAMTAAGTVVQASTSIATGTRLTTAWQAATVGNMQPGQQRVLSYSFVAPANGNVAFANSGNWQASNSGLSTQAAATSFTRAENASPLDIWIEYEFADDNAPVILVVGSSLCNGGNNNQTPNQGPIGSWPQQWAQKHKGVAASIAISGTSAFHFASGNTRWDRFTASLNQPLDVDAVVYFQPISSDILSGADGSSGVISACKTNFINMVTRGRTLYPNARHVITNMAPRVEFTGSGATTSTYENARLLCNEWLALLPLGVDACVDVDSLVTDWADPARLRAVFNADGTHGKPRYHQACASVIPVTRG